MTAAAQFFHHSKPPSVFAALIAAPGATSKPPGWQVPVSLRRPYASAASASHLLGTGPGALASGMRPAAGYFGAHLRAMAPEKPRAITVIGSSRSARARISSRSSKVRGACWQEMAPPLSGSDPAGILPGFTLRPVELADPPISRCGRHQLNWPSDIKRQRKDPLPDKLHKLVAVPARQQGYGSWIRLSVSPNHVQKTVGTPCAGTLPVRIERGWGLARTPRR